MNFTRILLLILLVVSRSAFVHFEYYSLLDIYAFLYNYGFGQMFCITKYSQIKLWNSRHFNFFFFTTGNIWIIFRYNKSIFLFFFIMCKKSKEYNIFITRRRRPLCWIFFSVKLSFIYISAVVLLWWKSLIDSRRAVGRGLGYFGLYFFFCQILWYNMTYREFNI